VNFHHEPLSFSKIDSLGEIKFRLILQKCKFDVRTRPRLMQKTSFRLLIAFFALFASTLSYGQCDYTVSPSTHHNWIDVSAQFKTNETGLGFDSTILRYSDKMQVASEPLNSTQDLVTRSFVQFDLYVDKFHCGWSAATLKLMFTGNQLDSHNVDSGANDFIISRIVEPWGDDTLRWKAPPINAQYRMPLTTSKGSILVTGSTKGDEDFEVNIRSLLEFWRSYPDSNFGFEIKLANESGKRSLNFTSSEFGTPAAHPLIEGKFFDCKFNDAYAGEDVEICNGSSTTLSGKYGEFYSWSGGPVSNKYIASPVATPTTTTMYYLTTTAGSCITTDSVLVTVNEYPTLNVPGTQEICKGDSAKLTATGNAILYTWTPNMRIKDAFKAEATAYPLVTTEYTVTADNGTPCLSDAKVNVVVRNLTPTDAGDNTLICEGDEAQLLATGGNSYTWINNTAGLSKTTGQDPKASPTVSTTYYVEATNGFCPVVDSVTVTVIPKFQIDAGEDDSICLGDTAFFSAANGYSFYRWSPTQEMNNPFVPSPYAKELKGTTEFELYVEDKNGCSSSDKITIVLNNPPELEIGRDTFVCLGSDILVELEKLEGNSPYRYLWSDDKGDTTGVGFLNNAQSRDINISGFKDTIFLYTLKVTDKFGCTSEDDITVSMLPLLDITTYGDTTICKGASVEIGVEGGKYYEWSGPGIISIDTRKKIKVQPETVTTYTVEAGNGEACSDGVLGYVTVNVIEPPAAYIHTVESEAEVDTLLVCKGRYANLVASGADYYVWNVDSLNEQLDFRLVTPTAILTVYGISEGGLEAPDCAGPEDTILLMLDPHDSCLSKIFAPNAFTPNRDGDNDSFTVRTLLIRDYRITIFNRWGQELYTSDTPLEPWSGYYKDERVPEGTYFYIIDAFGEDEESRSTKGTVTVIY